MHRTLVVAAFFISGLMGSVRAQKTDLEPLHVTSGTVLTFHLQTRLHATGEDETDKLPRGTNLRVKMLESVDSAVDRDGTEFRGLVVSAVVSGDEIIVHPNAEIHGVLVLLRSKSHPDGFRYELLITGMKDQGKFYDVTASLNPSLFVEPSDPTPTTKPPTN